MTVVTVELPGRERPLDIDDGRWAEYRSRADAASPETPSRLVYGALRVVMRDDYRAVDHHADRPGAPDAIAEAIDWDATTALRRRLAGHGFGIAEAMDTAQRFELGWASARRLIELTGRLQPVTGFVAGAGTDHLDAVHSATDAVDGVVFQARLIADAGGIPVLLPIPWLTRTRAGAAVHVDVYRAIIDQLDGPHFVHWLGAMFAPALAGYFPDDSFERVMDIDPATTRGAKLSLLDAALEVRLRRRLLANDQILLTGDDLSFPTLIEGTDPAIRRRTRIGAHDVALGDFSHGLLGIIDGTAAPAALALRLLDGGDVAAYREIMDACADLGRIVFEPPTHLYKVGLALLGWLNGLQTNPMLVNHLEEARPREHLVRVVEAAAAAEALTDAACAGERVRSWQAT